MPSSSSSNKPLTQRQSILRLIKKANGAWRDAGSKNGGYRVQPTRLIDPPPPEHLLEIATGLGMKILKVLPPRSAGACSGKYQTYLVRDPQCVSPWKVVCGSGGNRGHRFEHEVIRALKSLCNGTAAENRSKYPAGMKMAKAICSGLGIVKPSKDILAVQHLGKRNMARSVDFAMNPSGVGSSIADLAITYTRRDLGQRTVYVSLKGHKAATVASVGAFGCFRQSGNKIVQTDRHQIVNNLLRYLAVDVDRVTKGLTNAKNKTKTKMARPSMVMVDTKVNSSHRKLLRQFLINSIGFGYYAATQDQKHQSSFRFVSRRSVESMVGSKIESVVLSYPRYYSEKDKSKQLTATVTTNKARFRIELRNTYGNILPQEVKVTICNLHHIL